MLKLFVVVAASICFGWQLFHVSAQTSCQTLPYVELKYETNIARPAWHPDGSLLAIPVGNEIVFYSPDLEEIDRLVGHTDRVIWVAWSADGRKLASSSDDATLKIWDMVEDSHIYKSVVRHLITAPQAFDLIWSPVVGDNRLAFTTITHVKFTSQSAFSYTRTQIWDMSTGELLHRLPEQVNPGRDTWSPDGQKLVTSGISSEGGYSLFLWDTNTGEIDQEFDKGNWSRFYSLAWQPGGQLLASGSEFEIVFIEDMQKIGGGGGLRLVLPSYSDFSGETYSLTWSPDGTKLAAGGMDKHVIIWDVPTALVLCELSGHPDDVYHMVWSPDGSQLVSVSGDDLNVIRVWDVRNLPDVSGIPTATFSPTLTPTPVANLG